MKLVLILVVHCYLMLVCSVPLIVSHDLSHAVERGVSLAKKMLSDIPAVHETCVKTTGLTLELSGEAKNLEYLFGDISIPEPPVLKTISENLTLAMSLSRIVEGLELHHKLLQRIREFLTSTEKLDLLLADIRDLSSQVQEMQQLAQIPSTVSQKAFPDLSPNLDSDYQVQVTTHLSLQQLRSFTQDVFRSLRQIAVSS
ncbi:LOW QUALITY PROTEIN: colony stimulating factor 3 (granulocyte) b [Myxocyprinus asiaticus]|uniref:LOW QUALITY PROTEIN: colony stimulating factor 3 (granulocyte) b n=1 Tax=Myxocyprinus asiaticus TaxID=70543 RepID=UPI002221A270|nr:LOW QUALITY PROTEIN: colony stimulating factor 3 (granulocyte) b [Myxocyprinus asiaticus]